MNKMGLISSFVYYDDKSLLYYQEPAVKLNELYTITISNQDLSNTKLYINGALVKENKHSKKLNVSSSFDNLYISNFCDMNTCGPDSNQNSMTIYSVRIYNRQLSDAEVKQNANQDQANYKK